MRAFTSALDRHAFILKQPHPRENSSELRKLYTVTRSHSVDSAATSPVVLDNTDYINTLSRQNSTKQNNPYAARGDEEELKSPTAETELRRSHAKILLVDDNPINLRVCAVTLSLSLSSHKELVTNMSGLIVTGSVCKEEQVHVRPSDERSRSRGNVQKRACRFPRHSNGYVLQSFLPIHTQIQGQE